MEILKLLYKKVTHSPLSLLLTLQCNEWAFFFRGKSFVIFNKAT